MVTNLIEQLDWDSSTPTDSLREGIKTWSRDPHWKCNGRTLAPVQMSCPTPSVYSIGIYKRAYRAHINS